MPNISRRHFTLAASILLAGCATGPVSILSGGPTDFPKNGIALISIGYAGKIQPYQRFWLSFATEGGMAADVQFAGIPNNFFVDGKNTITSNIGTADLNAVALPPGQYRIVKLGAFTDSGPMSFGGISRAPLKDMTFTIRSGEVTYLGSALLTRIPGPSYSYFYDIAYSEPDIQRFRQIRPDLTDTPISTSLLASEGK